MAAPNTLLRYDNSAFAIYHLIANCPPSSVIRELIKNAIECVSSMAQPGRIEFFIEDRSGIPKLGLRNEGPGMSADKLNQYMDLASTGKTLGEDHNFGQGAKVSGLSASPYGLLYRSCNNGMVHEIALNEETRAGYAHPVYVKRRHHVGDGRYSEVVDVSESFPERTHYDWTEVVLLGLAETHDTVRELLPDDNANWLMRRINQRFYRFAPSVQISKANISTGSREARAANGLESCILSDAFCEQREDVAVQHSRIGKLTIRYFKLVGRHGQEDSHSRKSTLERYGVSTNGSHVCIVYKDECYDFHGPWQRLAGRCGILFGSGDIAVHVLLPDDASVKNNTYRNQIIDRHDEHQPILVSDFAHLIAENRPEWLIQYIESFAQDDHSDADLDKRLRQFMRELQSNPVGNNIAGQGADEGVRPGNYSETGGSSRETATGEPSTRRPPRGTKAEKAKGPPGVRFATDQSMIDEMAGRAATYRLEDNTVYLNPQHWKYTRDLELLKESVGCEEAARRMAKQYFEAAYRFHAGRFVLTAWLFKGRAEWTDQEWHEAISDGSLTVHLASPDSLREAKERMGRKGFVVPEPHQN